MSLSAEYCQKYRVIFCKECGTYNVSDKDTVEDNLGKLMEDIEYCVNCKSHRPWGVAKPDEFEETLRPAYEVGERPVKFEQEAHDSKWDYEIIPDDQC